MKRIFITGDWVADWNLARPASLPEGYFDGSLQTQLHHRAGGAWYVAHLIENVACRDLTDSSTRSLTVTLPRDPVDSIPGLNKDGTQRDDLAHAYSVWWKHRRMNAAKKEDEVWRIARFAGCRKATTWQPPVAEDKMDPYDFVVVDDLGLGVSGRREVVDHVTSYAGESGAIILKHGVRPDGCGLLPQLLKKRELSTRLHVVTAANALRRRNAAVSPRLSWDKILEDIEIEFKSGPSSRDLARCATAVVHFGLAGAAVFQQGKLHRFYFLPDELENAWEDDRPGKHFGTGSVLTACMARHLITPDDYPLFFAVTQALAAQRVAHHEGAGKADEMNIDLAFGPHGKAADPAKNPAAACIGPVQPNDKSDAKHLAGIQPFRAAWNPADIAVWPEATAVGLKRSRLLCNECGTKPDALHAKGVEVVIQGPEKALAGVPKASYGKYLTTDRDEIESINEIRRLILEYKTNADDKNPLSIAVFGAPGSGKSFAIKQIAKAIFGKDKEPLEFNLTQIKTPQDLYGAFHQVRDASIRLEIPLVFWDEFDTAGLQWLADFLAPMQDHEFFDGSHKHPLGKCIFVFAGGTRTTFEEFKSWASLKPGENDWKATDDRPWHDTFKALKGPDFISRLRGFVNVKGPNPTPPHAKATLQECIAHDPAFVLRRAVIFRSEIERSFPQLIDSKSKRVAIAPNILYAFLSVNRYEHGARSISAVLNMSGLTGVKAFTVSALPNSDLLLLHVSQDFTQRLNDPVASADLHEPLARLGFEAWKAEKERQGYKAGPKRNDDATKPPLTHPLIKDWDALNIEEKASNYDPIWRRLLAIRSAGYNLEPQDASNGNQTPKCIPELIEALLAPEHAIWLADHLSKGYTIAHETRDHLRQHADVRSFASLPKEQQDLNRSIVTATLEAICGANFQLVKQSPPTVPAH